MIVYDDYLTTKVRDTSRAAMKALGVKGKLNPAVLFGLGGKEYGVPLDLRPFLDPGFLRRNIDALMDASELVGAHPAAILATAAAAEDASLIWWPVHVACSLRRVGVDWFVVITEAYKVPGRRALSVVPTAESDSPVLLVAGANMVRSFAVVTPFDYSDGLLKAGEEDCRDSICGREGMGGPFAGIYIPEPN